MNEQNLERSSCDLRDCMVLSKRRLSKLFDKDTLKYLENCTVEHDCMPFQQGVEEMATRINRTIMINGVKKWIHANTEQEYAEKIWKLYSTCSASQKHNFGDYALNWFETYSKPNVGTVTATTYKRQIDLYLIPTFGDKSVEDISADDVQRLFNKMENRAKTTKDKAKGVLNMILDMAVEDGLLQKNPLQSKRLRITGRASKSTEPYTVEEMRYLIQHLDKIKQPQDRAYLALQALHPMRLEEVLGLKWEDIDLESHAIHIQRAVTHPTRNQPEVKSTKTESSKRTLALSGIAASCLTPGKPDEFIVGGGKPLSYSQVRKMCDRIQRETGFCKKITPIRFRTTALTDLYDQTKDIKLAQAAAGHTTAAMTLKHYVKGREERENVVSVLDNVYGA